MSERFNFEKLPGRHIRLLDLHPGELSSPFHGTLRHASLDHSVFYEALSYTWGAPATSSYLRCDNGSIPLTLNLAQALSRLRRTDRIRTLWIDQICINQNDDVERGQQVSLMGDIYRGAAIVDVWLGEEDEETGEAVAYIPHLLKSFSAPDERDEVGDEVPHVVQALSILTLKSPRWMALRGIFERPYFRRMWIVQEVALGQKVTVHCGSHSVTWSDLAKGALCLEEDAGRQLEAHRVVRMINGLKRQGDRSFINLLHQSFNLLCTNPRDKMYGVLGLASDISADEFVPNYSLSCQDVYLATTIFCINKYSSLEILCHVRNPKNLSEMPSWVPDWTVISPLRDSLGFTFSEQYCAAGKTPPVSNFHFSEDQRTLYANGKFVDKIQEIGKMFPTEDGLMYERYAILSEWEQIARSVSLYATGETLPIIFWRLLFADGGTRGKDSDHARQQLYESYENLWDRNMNTSHHSDRDWEPVAEMSIVNTRGYKFESMMSAACFGRRIAVTEQSFLGLVPADAQVGDEVCILESVRVPLVLRPVPVSEEHHLIGECYLQGWMDGSRFGSSPSPNVQFSLV